MFVDTVQLQLVAGKGGDGIISWRREKYIPKGGPAGGDGGNGASIVLETDPQIHSLEALRNRRIIKAPNGGQGGPNNRKGANGPHLVLKIPPGTLVKDAKTGELIRDLTQPGEQWALCQGGFGGKGNSRFKSATHQAPYVCTPGTSGDSREVELELKLIADVGLVGMPNAGKSTLISALAKIAVKIAPYPFTTLRPNLGLVEFDDFSRILIADIPGIIENAHDDRGLGLSFLRHIERTSTLLFLIELAPNETRDPVAEYEMLRRELAAYSPDMLAKPSLVVLNKIDQEGADLLAADFTARTSLTPHIISAQTGAGLPALKEAIRTLAQRDGKRFI